MSNPSELCSLSAMELLGAYKKRSLSPVEVMRAHLERAERINPVINALFSMRAHNAMEQARASENRWMQGAPSGVLDGIPILLKDSVKCKGFDYFHGSAGYTGDPANEDAPPAARIKEAGGIVFAKTTMPDFGMLAAGVSSAFGIVRNAWDQTANSGGSSAGSGAAVAARIAPLAVGTDIAGSVRLPAAHHGLTALKPSRGRIPHLAPSPLRAAGPMARTAADAALLMSVLIGPDDRDFESLPPIDPEPFRHAGETPEDFLKGKRIGLLLDAGYGQPLDPRIATLTTGAAHLMEDAGADIEITPSLVRRDPMPHLNLYLQSRAHNELMSLPEDRREKVLPYLIDWSRKVENHGAPDLSDALYGLEDFKSQVTTILQPYDFVISPSMTCLRFPAEAYGADRQDHFAHCSYAIPFNQTGAPAQVICCGFVDGMPVNIQIVGRRHDDLGVMRAAAAFEKLVQLDMHWPFSS